MMITIKYLGLIAEVTKCSEEQMAFSGRSISDLLDELFLKYPTLKSKSFQVAQNHQLVLPETQVTGTEIALLPPFAGG